MVSRPPSAATRMTRETKAASGMAWRGSRPGTPNMDMDVDGGRKEKREESGQVSMDANGKKDDRVDVEKLLRSLHVHKRHHEDDTYPLSLPSTTKRCQEIAGRHRLTILRLLRKVAKAPDDKVAEILVGACEAIKLLVEGELCPHFDGIFLDFSGGANASRPQTVRGSRSVEPAVTTLLYLMTYASQVRYQDQQATVIDAMATLVLLMQQSDFYAFLHFFGDAVELLEDCVLLEGCLERRGFHMSSGKASIACFLDTAVHAYHSTSGSLGSTHTEILCGCVPVEEQSRVFERKEQLKTLLPQMKVTSFKDLTYLRKAIELIIIKITVTSGSIISHDRSFERMCAMIEELLGRDAQLVEKCEQGAIESSCLEVANVTCNLLWGLLKISDSNERSFIRIARSFFDHGALQSAIRVTQDGVVGIASICCDTFNDMSEFAKNELWPSAFHWCHRVMDRVHQSYEGDFRNLQDLLQSVFRIVATFMDVVPDASMCLLNDLLALVDAPELETRVLNEVVRSIQTFLSEKTQLIQFVRFGARAIISRQHSSGDGPKSTRKRRRLGGSEARPPVKINLAPSAEDLVECCKRLVEWVLDLVFSKGTEDVRGLVVALRIVLPFRPLTDRFCRMESSGIFRSLMHRIEDVLQVYGRIHEKVISIDFLHLVTLALMYLSEFELIKLRGLFQAEVSLRALATGLSPSSFENALVEGGVISITTVLDSCRASCEVPEDDAPTAFQSWIVRCDGLSSHVMGAAEVCQRVFLIVFLTKRLHALKIDASSWVDSTPGRVLARLCAEHKQIVYQRACSTLLPMVMVFAGPDRNGILKQVMDFQYSRIEACETYEAKTCWARSICSTLSLYLSDGIQNSSIEGTFLDASSLSSLVTFIQSAASASVPDDFLVELVTLTGLCLQYGQLDLRGNASKLVDFFLESLSNPAKAIRECASQQLQVLVHHEEILDELLVPSSGTVGLMERIGDAIRNSQDGSMLTRSCIDILGTAARGKSSTNASSRILVWGLLQLAFVWIDYYSDDAKKGFSAAAFDQIQRTMSYHRLSWRKMFLEYPGEVYFPLVDSLLRTRSVKDFVSTFMGQTMTKGILTDSAAYVLPHYVIHRDEDMLNQFVLECNQGDGDVEMEDVDSEAHSENTTIGQLLQENISSVFKELIMHQVQEGKKEEHMKVWNFLFKFFPENFTIGDVLSLRQLQVLSAIAAELGGERHHHAKLAFHEISQYVIKGTRVNNAEAGLVMPRQFFLAIMTTFGNTISDKSTQLAMRIRTVKSIDRLFNIFKRSGDEAGASSVLDAFVPKVMAILKIGMADPGLQKYSIQAWGNFIRMLTTKALETNFISIVVSVLPYTRLSDGDAEISHQKNLDKQRSPREYTREAAIKIIRYLFVEKRDDLVKAFPKVAILPSTPDLDESSAALMSVVGDPARLNLRDILQNCVSYINHWDMAVRERILDHLYHTLVTRTSELEGLVQSEGDLFVDAVVVETLVSILKVASLDTDTNIRLLCSKCLGALGAIDGARMPFNFLHSKSDKINPRSETQAKEKGDTRSELPTKDLALVLIEDWLVKELRAAPENTDSVAFAIQELLKFLSDLTLNPQHSGQQVDDIESAVRRSKVGVGPIPDALKRQFDKKEVFQFVEPYWSTNYSVQNSRLRESDPGRDDSTFYEDYRMSYEKWLSTWCRRLIKLSQAPERKIFNACRNILFECPQIARFLLPYLIQNVLRSGRPEVYEEVKREVIAVLKDNGIIDDGATGGYSATQMPHEGQDDARERAFADYASRHHQCAQTVFSTIDELNEWVWKNEKKRFASSASSRASGDVPSELDDHEKENLEEFLKDIPSQVLSSAAFRIRAHARALQYFEVYLRQQQAPPSSDSLHAGISPVELSLVAKHATYLQQLHSSTDEPDALTGLATLRRLHEAYRHADISTERRVDGEEWTSLTYLLHQVVDFEQLAQWEDALACYEQAIQEVQSAQANRAFYSKEFPPDVHDGVSGVDSGFPTDPHLVKPDLYSGIVRCLIQLGRLESALQHINGIVTQEPQFVGTLYPHALACAWRLSRWDLVSDLLNSERDTSLLASSFAQGGVQSRLRNMEVSQLTLVRVLKNFHDCDRVALSKNLQEARLEIMGPLAAAATESYERAYPLLHKLHFLHEVEQGFSWLERSKSLEPDERSHEWTKQCPWDSRYEIMSASVKFRDPILALRRMMLQEADLPGEVSRIWLQYAKMARKEGYIRTANSAVMHAEALDNPYASLERAKLMVAQDRVHQALQILEPVDIDATKLDFNVEDPHFCAKNLLLATNWMQESGQRQGKKVIERYEAVIKFDPSWEKGYFFLAKYYEYLLNVRHPELQSSSSAGEESSLNLDDVFHSHLINLIKNYVLALSHGTKYLFQSMPRLLTLWFEFGELLQSGSRTSSVNKAMRSIEADVNQSNTEEQVLSDITRIMQNAAERLPAYEWLVCFPQVASRICHPNPVVVDGVKRIMLKVLSTYPTQAMWPLLGLSRSLNAQRRARARDIIANAQRQFVSCGQNEVANSFAEGMRLAEELISLAGHDPGNQRRIQIRLTRLRAQILVPIQATLNTVLPSSGLAPGDERHAAFSSTSVVYIQSFIDRADVMMTKEKPKRIVIHGTDGKQYPFLCKREKTGDLRKDARMMEFNTMINKLLQKDREGRKRKLRLRTYAVVCLNEESGLMEWVPNTRAMRQLIGQIHKTERGLIPPVRLTQDIKERYLGMQKKYADHIPTMATYYRRKILSLPVFTPRFHQWFTNNFADPTAWFEARLMFSRSAAVWSMVGHIIGLGDRHGENILIDTTNGECVHVDFDCLFDKGLKLAKPEIVPFRLTPNMIDAFGITGYEGVFRRVCEVTMGLLRENKETLRSVLEAFIHDPLVEWGRRGKNTQGSTTGTTGRSIAEITSDRSKEETRVILKAIDGRLSGVYNLGEAIRPQLTPAHRKLLPENETLPLSVQGQVDKLIHEATAHENLAQMYIGWMPFL